MQNAIITTLGVFALLYIAYLSTKNIRVIKRKQKDLYLKSRKK